MAGLDLHDFRTAGNWMSDEGFEGMNFIWSNYRRLRHLDVSYSGLTSTGLTNIAGARSGFKVGALQLHFYFGGATHAVALCFTGNVSSVTTS